GTTAVHAFSYPVGTRFHIPHGLANAMMLPHVLRFNIEGGPGKFALLAPALGIETGGTDGAGAAEAVVGAVQELTAELGVNRRLSEFGVTEADIPGLASALMKVTRNLSNNPRPVTVADAEALYRSAL
ncbi:MAG: iron-containing alcohol dehydrogenase, partial [Gemmatimonadetes bacterium]|nr:iron-containing alcohol dehydrogenase [Gemmatimonadota bacterium]